MVITLITITLIQCNCALSKSVLLHQVLFLVVVVHLGLYGSHWQGHTHRDRVSGFGFDRHYFLNIVVISSETLDGCVDLWSSRRRAGAFRSSSNGISFRRLPGSY